MDPQIKGQLKQTIYVATASSISSAGETTYGTPASRAARVVRKDIVVTGPGGEQRASSHTILTESEIALSSRIWMPGDSSADATLARVALSTEPVIGELGENLGWLTRV